MSDLRYRRVLLKLSGEALQDKDSGIAPAILQYLAEELATVLKLGVQVAVVIGGGNIVRGAMVSTTMGVDRVTGDYMGMLATVINGMAIQSALTNAGITARLQTALNIEQIAPPYIREKALSHMKSGRVVIFGGGTGNPYFTTDTAAALRAAEIGAEALLKATNVDGVYSGDPHKDANVHRYDEISVEKALNENLRVMDATALAMCRERKLPVHVFQMMKKGALENIVLGNREGTVLTV